MRRILSLRVRIYLLLGALTVATLSGGAFTLWYAARMETLFGAMINKGLAAVSVASDLEISLASQKGLVTAFFLDGNTKWLEMLAKRQESFEVEVIEAKAHASSIEANRILARIESNYLRYAQARDRVIGHYRNGEREAGRVLHIEARAQFDDILGLCSDYRSMHQSDVERAGRESLEQVRLMSVVALTLMPVVLGLAVFLAIILSRQVLGPIRRMALGGEDGKVLLPNEVEALHERVQDLIEHVGQARVKLEKSREHLVQSEKLAMVGKMAAGVAHSIRNPLTSVKMRLFSLERSLNLSALQEEDFTVISEEIRNLDTIVQNFLEFSRPPKLKKQRVSPSDVVDQALLLLSHRLEAARVEVEIAREDRLKDILIDPEQIKEVFVNLAVNALEAMPGGGRITIQEETGFVEPLGRVAVIRVIDTGPGVPEELRENVFIPFFSAKEEGTGLGLSIARRIVEEHGGNLSLTAAKGGGARFTITLPFDKDSQGGARWQEF
jgi:signal transduction histidine kinase